MRFNRLALLGAAAFTAASPQVAVACGCFVPPDPITPVAQAGERILFSVVNGQVTAIIQIQYSGNSGDFGWLLPLPSVPTLEVSSDQVFEALVTHTAPSYRVEYKYAQGCFPSPDLGVPPQDLGLPGGGGGPPDPLVNQGSVGPYDFAVLKADDKTAMLGWLADHRYFVPVGTDASVTPYLHPGAYFLALRLSSGRSSGEIQPVVVHYASDLPMIPITLTSVAATQNMGIWVWVLGASRAIPRNYHHTVLDDARLGWSPYVPGLPWNYEGLVAEAAREAPGHHTFITELAGKTAPLAPLVFPPSQFGDLAKLAAITDAGEYLRYLRNNGYSFNAALVAILQKYIKQPPGLQVRGFNDMGFGPSPSPANYYYNFDFWKQNNWGAFQGFDLSYDAAKLTAEIQQNIVKPVRDAATLFTGRPYVTRLHTALSPADMNSDPVFSFNPDLPDVNPVHNAVVDITCGKGFNEFKLTTEQGFVVAPYSAGTAPVGFPASLRIETLGEQGPPTVVTDNRDAIRRALGNPNTEPPDMAVGAGMDASSSVPSDGGAGPRPIDDGLGVPITTGSCRVAQRAGAGDTGPAAGLLLVALALVVRRRR